VKTYREISDNASSIVSHKNDDYKHSTLESTFPRTRLLVLIWYVQK